MTAIGIVCAVLFAVFTVTEPEASTCDVDGDGKTGLEEAIYALQVAAGMDPDGCRENSDCSLSGEYCAKAAGECAARPGSRSRIQENASHRAKAMWTATRASFVEKRWATVPARESASRFPQPVPNCGTRCAVATVLVMPISVLLL